MLFKEIPSIGVHKAFFENLGKRLGIKKLDDWYNITKATIDKHGGEINA